MKLKSVTKVMLTLLAISMVTISAGKASLPLALAQTSSSTTVYLDPPTINGTAIGVNNNVTVELKISEAVDFSGWQAGLLFDATLLECLNFTEGEFLNDEGPTYWANSTINNTLGVVDAHACFFLGNYSVSGSGRLANLTFRVKALGVSDLHLRDVKLADYTTAEVPTNIIDVYTVLVDTTPYTVVIVSNSTGMKVVEINGNWSLIHSGFYGHGFTPEYGISFNVTSPRTGWSNVTIPDTLMSGTPNDWTVTLDGTPLSTENRTITYNGTHYSVYFAYEYSIHEVIIQEDTAPPTISVLSPENMTFYPENNVPLDFTVDEPADWMGYSLNGQTNVTIPGNITLTSLADGEYDIVVYANDTAGNMGASDTIQFYVDTTAPNITDVSQTPLANNVLPEDEVKVNATVTDDLSGVKQVTLNYTNGNGTWIIVEMTNLEGNIWNGTIPAFEYCTDVNYTIVAEDEHGNSITTEGIFGYQYQYHVIPEFPSALILPLFMFFTLIAIALTKKTAARDSEDYLKTRQ